jgi:excisionase family DNA binding protein
MTIRASRDKEFFSTHDAAKICRVTPMTVIRWIKEGKIPAFTTAGGHRRIARSDLTRFCTRRGIPLPIETQPEAGRMLVVDSDPSVRDSVADAARALDARLIIEMAADAFSAGQALATFRPQLLFLDHRLPGIDVPELVARLARGHEGEPLSIAVMVSALNADLERTFRARGALGCLAKPPVVPAVDRLVRAVFHLPSDGPSCIHIIDPDVRAGRLLRRDLETRLPGCRVSVFESPIDALFAIPVDRPDLILLDTVELDLGPAELIRRLVTRDSAQPVPILAVGSARGESQRAQLLAAGARAVLVKPFEVERIVEHLHPAGARPDGLRRRR